MFTLRKLVGIQTFKLFLAKDVSNYYSDITREVLTYQSYHDYPIAYFYLGCFLTTILFFSYNPKLDKMDKIEKIEKNWWFIKLFILVFTMIFTKNIENAI